MMLVELWLSALYAWYNGAMVVALTEAVPANVRTSGFALAYSLATTLGGSSLAISTWLIRETGDKASPGYWMSFAALCGLAATLFIYAGGGRGAAAAPAPRLTATKRLRGKQNRAQLAQELSVVNEGHGGGFRWTTTTSNDASRPRSPGVSCRFSCFATSSPISTGSTSASPS